MRPTLRTRSLAAASFVVLGSLSGLAQTAVPTFGTTVVIPSGLRGLIYYIRRGTSQMPRFGELEPIGIIYTNGLNVPEREFTEGFEGVSNRVEWFAIDYSGRFWIDPPGNYKFALTSDDGGKLYLDGRLQIDNDGIHLPQRREANLNLSAGIHTIRVSYFQGPRYYLALILEVAIPKSHWRIFNTDEFKPPQDPEQWDAGERGDLKSAPSGIPRTSFTAPPQARSAFLAGLSALSYGNRKLAESSLRQAVATYPAYAQAWSSLGQVLELESNPEEAREVYGKALAIDPKYVRAMERLANLDLMQGRYQDALTLIDRAVALDPPDALVYSYSAAANAHLNRWDIAENMARRAIELDSAREVPEAEGLLGRALAAKGNGPEALEHLKIYEKLWPRPADLKEVGQLIAELERRLKAPRN